MSGVRLIGRPDTCLGWDGRRAYLDEDVIAGAPQPGRLDGAAAGIQFLGNGAVRIFRDRLGIGKLFWARRGDGGIDVAARPARLVAEGHRLDDISAVPRGFAAEFDAAGRMSARVDHAPPRGARGDSAMSLPDAGARIRGEVDAYLGAIAAACPGRRAYVCLSGGLDSSTVAVIARHHFPDMVAVSFDLTGPARRESEDRVAAQRLAGDLGIAMIESNVTADQLLEWLDLALVEGIDWRDFNVHCALVNAALASTIAADGSGLDVPPLVITGDLANEFLVDYHGETYRGVDYYTLPRISPARLRDILVHGLDTCHREVGIFEAWGLSVVQPYAVAVDTYLGLSPAFLEEAGRKDELVREIVGDELPDYIYRRPKVRAQMGGTDGSGGTLAACVDTGIDAGFLRRRFAELHDTADEDALDRFIRAGRYRAAVPAPEEEVHATV
jgi:asparagine synthetase B (glutamine-hydrolysing)